MSQNDGQRSPVFTVPLNPRDTAVLLIDFQDGLLQLSRTVEHDRLRVAAVWLVKLARLFDMPVVLSTALLDGPARVTAEIEEALGNLEHHVPGRSTANAFTHAPTASKIAGLGRKTLLVAGLVTEVAVQHSALSATERGFNAQIVVDACGGTSPRTEDAAFRRLTQAGVATTSCASLAGQLMGDITHGPTAAAALQLLFEITTSGSH